MKKNKKAASLILAILLTLVMMSLVLYILEYIIPYSKNVKGIENSANAFYQAETSIDDGMLFFKTRINLTQEKSKNFGSSVVDYKYNTESLGTIIPPSGDGNSEFDKDYNKISQGNPIQLKIGKKEIGDSIDWSDSSTKLDFRVPKINGNRYTLSGSNLAIINWQLSAKNQTLNATGSWITASNINSYLNISMDNKQGVDLDGNETNNQKFGNFYGNNCTGTNSGCTLKLSVINKLESDSGNIPIPYLEYKLEFDIKVPLRYSRIKAAGKSYGFQKYLKIRIPQQTTNEAFDFTVFQ